MNESHTLEKYRRDVWFPRFFDRRPFETWFAGGAEVITELLRRKALDIMAAHQPPQLSPGQLEMMNKILDRRSQGSHEYKAITKYEAARVFLAKGRPK